MYQESLERGLTHLFCVMAKGLHKILTRLGVVVQQIGPTVQYHGERTPYLFCIADMVAGLEEKNPPCIESSCPCERTNSRESSVASENGSTAALTPVGGFMPTHLACCPSSQDHSDFILPLQYWPTDPQADSKTGGVD